MLSCRSTCIMQLAHNIQAIASKGDLTFAAVGSKIVVCKRAHRCCLQEFPSFSLCWQSHVDLSQGRSLRYVIAEFQHTALHHLPVLPVLQCRDFMWEIGRRA